MSVDIEAVTIDDPGGREEAPGSVWIAVLFAATSLVGASLLFVVQPLIARLILPYFGGSATVWSTSSLFFQLVLLVGYIYVHASTQRLGRKVQPLLHFAVLLLPLLALPIMLPGDVAPAEGASPVFWLLRTLVLTIGLPFAVISATGPLLQRWYSWTVGRRSQDPYFLFATSNLGSFGGLLAYPFLIEPFLTLDQQRAIWSSGFVLFLILMIACGVTALRGQPRASAAKASVVAKTTAPTRRTAVWWLFLAFLPSSLMLGVTAHISTDIAAIPLMWVVPLAIYLATFVVAFARTTRVVNPVLMRVAVVVAAVAAFASFAHGGLPIWMLLTIDLVLLAVAAFAAHAQLAASRPAPDHLTRFYLIVAAGGALGGLLNGMIAPILFNSVWEYPLVLVMVVGLGAGIARRPWGRLARRYHPAFIVFLEAAGFIFLVILMVLLSNVWLKGGPILALALLVVWSGAAILGSLRPIAFAASLAVVLVVIPSVGSEVLHRERTFYGSYRVTESAEFRQFSHGTTVHGSQPKGVQALEPTTYYARSGPVGAVFDVVQDPAAVGVVGLGVGSIAAYGEAGQAMTFFEIDPAVVDVARDPALFTYLSSSAADLEMVVGDGRLRLGEASPGQFDLLFIDAFTSDAIPMHLLTLEAFTVYADALSSDGVLMVHISNRVFDLEPVIASAAEHLGWKVLVGEGVGDELATPSVWLALSDSEATLAGLRETPGWREVGPERTVWTDDFASVLSVLR